MFLNTINIFKQKECIWLPISDDALLYDSCGTTNSMCGFAEQWWIGLSYQALSTQSDDDRASLLTREGSLV